MVKKSSTGTCVWQIFSCSTTLAMFDPPNASTCSWNIFKREPEYLLGVVAIILRIHIIRYLVKPEIKVLSRASEDL